LKSQFLIAFVGSWAKRRAQAGKRRCRARTPKPGGRVAAFMGAKRLGVRARQRRFGPETGKVARIEEFFLTPASPNQARKALPRRKQMPHHPPMPAIVAQVERTEESEEALQNGDVSRSGRITPPPIAHLATKKKLIPFGWYGGKFSHLDWLLPLLPPCHHYCEPFAGSGAVLLNREPSPVETFNDLDGEVVNFFRVLREEKERLVEAIGLTPFAREEFALACEISPDLSALERARRFYVRARQVRTGLAQTATIGRWANCKNTSRGGMSGVISRWLGAVEDLPEVAERLLRVQIENRPAVNVIRL
jgi:hypothetical protein